MDTGNVKRNLDLIAGTAGGARGNTSDELGGTLVDDLVAGNTLKRCLVIAVEVQINFCAHQLSHINIHFDAAIRECSKLCGSIMNALVSL